MLDRGLRGIRCLLEIGDEDLAHAVHRLRRGGRPGRVRVADQETLHCLFDGVDHKTRDRIMFGAFKELFPDAPLPPDAGR